MVRRSNRLAGLATGFKDKPPTDGQGPSRDLVKEFEAYVVDTSAPAPPNLPISVLQTIGNKHCQMASEMLTEEQLNNTSGNDSTTNI